MPLVGIMVNLHMAISFLEPSAEAKQGKFHTLKSLISKLDEFDVELHFTVLSMIKKLTGAQQPSAAELSDNQESLKI